MSRVCINLKYFIAEVMKPAKVWWLTEVDISRFIIRFLAEITNKRLYNIMVTEIKNTINLSGKTKIKTIRTGKEQNTLH